MDDNDKSIGPSTTTDVPLASPEVTNETPVQAAGENGTEQKLEVVDQAIAMDLAHETRSSTSTGPLSVEAGGIAGPVDSEDSDGGAVKKTSRTVKRNLIIMLLVVVAVIIAVVVAFVVVNDNGGSGDADEVDGGNNNTNSPKPPAPATPAPVAPPPLPGTPTAAPTVATMRPTADPIKQLLVDHFSSISDAEAFGNETSAQSRAIDWLLQNDDKESLQDPSQLEQRYGLAVMDFALNGDIRVPKIAECFWKGITCENGTIVSLNWARSSLTGYIPDEIGLFQDLIRLDLGQNEIEGEIPESLYSLTSLERLYMHQNQLSGELSESIGGLFNLTDLYLGQNQLSGPFPESLRSNNGVGRPLRYLVLNHNQFTGSLPLNLRWRAMYYLDLSHNNFTGPLPADFGGRLGGVRVMYLDHNNFSGEIPSNLDAIAGGRMEVLHLNHNNFTGRAPTANVMMLSLHLHENNFNVPLEDDVCRFEVLNAIGEIVSLKADCNICTCKYFCDDCNDKGAAE